MALTRIDAAFNNLTGNVSNALDNAQELSNRNGAPVGIWERDEWFVVCETDPESIEPSPESEGWTLHAVVDPDGRAQE